MTPDFMSYLCACCGQQHDELPDLGFQMPHHAFALDEDERAARVKLTADTCVIDDQAYFIRGVLRVPILDAADEYLGYGVWVSQKKENFETYVANFDSADIGPFLGWFSSDIAEFAPTLGLKARAHFQGGSLRPWIELAPADHPLVHAQHTGISLAQAWEIVHRYLPPAETAG